MATTNNNHVNANTEKKVDPSSQLVDQEKKFIVATNDELVPTLEMDMENLLQFFTPEQIENMKRHWSLFKSNLMNKDNVEFQGFFISDDAFDKPIAGLAGIVDDFFHRMAKMFPDKTEMEDAIFQVEQLAKHTMETSVKAHSIFNKISSSVQSAAAIINAYALAYHIYNFLRHKSKISAIRAGIMIYGFWMFRDQYVSFFQKCFPEISSVITQLIETFLSSPTKADDVELQAFEIDSKLMSSILEAVTHCTTAMLGASGKLSSKTLLTAIKTSESLPKFIATIVKSLSEIWNAGIAEKLGMDPIRFKTNDDPYLEEFERKITKLLKEKAEGSLPMTVQKLSEIADLIREGDTMYKKMPSDRDLIEVKRLLYDRLNDLRRVELEFRRAHVDKDGFRQEPVGVMFRGGPGVMKSTLLEHASYAFNAATLVGDDLAQFKRNPNSYTYVYKNEITHQDGFNTKTNVVLFDDGGQAKEVAGVGNSESMAAIRIINSFQCLFNSAAMEGKGNLYFQGRAVFWSTNMGPKKYSVPSVNSKEAFLRRFIFQYIVTPKREYCLNPMDDLMMQKIDMSKIPRSELHGGKEANPGPDHFNFHQTDMYGVVQVGMGVFTFDEMMEQVLDAQRQRALWLEQHKLNFARTIEKYEFQAAYSSTEVTTETGFESCQEPTLDELLGSLDDPPDAFTLVDILKQNYGDDPKLGLFLDIYEKSENVRNEAGGYYANSTIWQNPPLHHDSLWNAYQMFRHDPRVLQKLNRGEDLHSSYYRAIPWEAPRARAETFIERGSFSQAIKKALESVGSIIRDIIIYVRDEVFTSPIFMALAGAAAIWELYKYMNPAEREEEAQMHYLTPKNGIRTEKMTLGQIKESVQMQSCDLQGREILESISKKNVFSLYFCSSSKFKDDSTCKLLGRCTALDKGMFILPRHYIDLVYEVSQGDKSISHIHVVAADFTSVASCSVLEFITNSSEESLVESHMVVVNFTSFKPLKGILKYFLAEDKFCRMKGTFAITFNLPSLEMVNHSEAVLQKCVLKGIEVVKGLKYSADSGVGDCGVPIVARIPVLGVQRIIGFHIAGLPKGRGTDAYAGVVTYEDIMRATSKFTSVVEDTAHTQLEEVLELQAVPPCIGERFTVLGKYAKSHSPYGKSRIIKTELNDPMFHTTTMAPALTFPRGGIDPFAMGLAKYCKVSAKPDTDILKLAVDDLRVEWDKYVHRKFDTPVTLVEAIWGSEDHHFDSIKSSTSPGIPLKWEDKHIKERLFGLKAIRGCENPEYPQLKIEMDAFLKDCIAGKRRLWLFSDNGKDERRKIAKAISGDTRLFNGCPLMYYIAWRLMFGSFMGWFMDLSAEFGSSIKLNPFSGDWNEIARRLASFDSSNDPWVGAGDYKGFDGCEMPIIHDCVLDMINDWYNDGAENAQIRKVLWKELTNSRHICGNWVYEWFCSLPSGHPFTIFINCIYNMLAFRYVFYRMFQRDAGALADSFVSLRGRVFSQCVVLYVLGDDNIFAVCDDLKPFFNELTMPSLMAELGLVYTTESKGTAVQAFRRLTEVNYLKRSFRFEPLYGAYIAPLLLESLLELPMWVKQGESYSGNFIDNIETFIRELSQHDSKIFSKYQRKLRESLRMLNPVVLERADIHKSRDAYLVEVVNKQFYF